MGSRNSISTAQAYFFSTAVQWLALSPRVPPSYATGSTETNTSYREPFTAGLSEVTDTDVAKRLSAHTKYKHTLLRAVPAFHPHQRRSTSPMTRYDSLSARRYAIGNTGSLACEHRALLIIRTTNLRTTSCRIRISVLATSACTDSLLLLHMLACRCTVTIAPRLASCDLPRYIVRFSGLATDSL